MLPHSPAGSPPPRPHAHPLLLPPCPLQAECVIHDMASGVDYRRLASHAMGTYFTTPDKCAHCVAEAAAGDAAREAAGRVSSQPGTDSPPTAAVVLVAWQRVECCSCCPALHAALLRAQANRPRSACKRMPSCPLSQEPSAV